ncbi:hypothetical protein [Cohnella sp. M.A.Huq-80]|uniref:hypothetical protein n=1 Tax=Cohnella sp. M.A.Huq-80 TaxID=3459299 RepID=UPI00403FEB01
MHANSLEDVPDTITDMCMLDGRGMNPARMTRRIAEHVTQIGLEMRMIGGVRKLVRIGEYEWKDGEIEVRDVMRYEEREGRWRFPEPFSERALARIARMDPDGLELVRRLAEAEGC